MCVGHVRRRALEYHRPSAAVGLVHVSVDRMGTYARTGACGYQSPYPDYPYPYPDYPYPYPDYPYPYPDYPYPYPDYPYRYPDYPFPYPDYPYPD
jgi:hypothetical protein